MPLLRRPKENVQTEQTCLTGAVSFDNINFPGIDNDTDFAE